MQLKEWNYNINFEFDKYQNIKMWIKNKVSNKFNYDCDVSRYAMEVYINKYKFLDGGKIQIQYTQYSNGRSIHNPDFLKWEIYLDTFKPIKTNGSKANTFEKTFSGDTLNSFATFFNNFVRKFLDTIKYPNKPERFNDYWYTWIFENFDIIFSDYNLSRVENSKAILEEFDLFANLTHTIGNLFPVPLYFNDRRSRKGKYEFSDILLNAIYSYYDSKKDVCHLENIISPCDKIYYVTNWLDIFDTWDNFVGQYHFEMYLKDRKPIELWQTHSYTSTMLPEIGEEFLKYLKNTNYCIEKRGKSFCEMLSKNLDKTVISIKSN